MRLTKGTRTGSGTRKSEVCCPARVIARETADGVVRATFYSWHHGHSCRDVRHLAISSAMRCWMRKLLEQGMKPNAVLDTINKTLQTPNDLPPHGVCAVGRDTCPILRDVTNVQAAMLKARYAHPKAAAAAPPVPSSGFSFADRCLIGQGRQAVREDSTHTILGGQQEHRAGLEAAVQQRTPRAR